MEQQIQFKPIELEKGVKYKILCITDFTLHTASKQPTQSIGKKIKYAFDNNKPGRLYGFEIGRTSDNSDSIKSNVDFLKKDPELMKAIFEYEKQGYKVVIEIPEEVPIIIGKDTKEFIESKKGKRIIRGLAKNNESDKI